MSAIEELKQLLDERGIEWDDYDMDDVLWFGSQLGRIYAYGTSIDSPKLCVELLDCVDSPDRLVNMLFGKRSKAIIVSNGITGTCRCESCGNTIDPWDRYCKHCGARLEVERWTS